MSTDRERQLGTTTPCRLHHHAFVVRDQERNRHFMEDVLGLPLVATWAEQVTMEDVGHQTFCHTYYALDDGSALAFFQFADEAMYRRCLPDVAPQVTRFSHIALRVDETRQADLKSRLMAAGSPLREVDHGYCLSLYTKTPDGLELEFTVDPPHAEAIAERRKATAHADLSRWLSGDHRPNNHGQSILRPLHEHGIESICPD